MNRIFALSVTISLLISTGSSYAGGIHYSVLPALALGANPEPRREIEKSPSEGFAKLRKEPDNYKDVLKQLSPETAKAAGNYTRSLVEDTEPTNFKLACYMRSTDEKTGKVEMSAFRATLEVGGTTVYNFEPKPVFNLVSAQMNRTNLPLYSYDAKKKIENAGHGNQPGYVTQKEVFAKEKSTVTTDDDGLWARETTYTFADGSVRKLAHKLIPLSEQDRMFEFSYVDEIAKTKTEILCK